MAAELKSTVLGMITGAIAKIMTGDIGTAIVVAFLTGGAAYMGQIAVKGIHIMIKNKLKKNKQ